MDFLIELIVEFLVEGIFHLTVKNSKLKTWIKTVLFLLIAELFPVVFLWTSFQVTEWEAVLIIRILALCLGIGFLVLAFFGHKRAWKQVQ